MRKTMLLQAVRSESVEKTEGLSFSSLRSFTTVVFVKPNEGWQHSIVLSEQNPAMKIVMITYSYLICGIYPGIYQAEPHQ